MKKRPEPTFSLCHTTARLPLGWKDAAIAWQRAADNPFALEYILCVDEIELPNLPLDERSAVDRVVVNKGRRCSVDGWNTAAAAARGQVLITVADDWFPSERWDTLLVNVIPSLDKEYCVWVPTGGNPGIMTFSILTMPYYRRYGHIFWPEYISMLADDDFTARALKDNVVIDCRTTLPEFPHQHPAYGRGKTDEVYQWTGRPEAYESGQAIFERRKREGFSA
jgi:hypothetical protein